MTRYRLSAYLARLLVTGRKVLLVEGQADKRAFKRLLEEFVGGNRESMASVDIDTADMLEAPETPVMGNRQKIETLFQMVHACRLDHKLVGFVDREFRCFSLGRIVEDLVGQHVSEGNLVWSRGHSMENYCFDFETLRNPLRTFSVTEHFDRALDEFELVFQSTMKLACAVSLAGLDVGFLVPVKSSISWKIIHIHSGEVQIDLEAWRTVLQRSTKLSASVVDELLTRFAYWSDTVQDSSPEVVRWVCHGHIGLSVLWNTYARCVYDATGYDGAETAKVLGATESVRFNACIESWVQRALSNEVDFPDMVITLLGLRVS